MSTQIHSTNLSRVPLILQAVPPSCRVKPKKKFCREEKFDGFRINSNFWNKFHLKPIILYMELLLERHRRNYFISGFPATTLSSKGFHDVKLWSCRAWIFTVLPIDSIQRRTFLNLLGPLSIEKQRKRNHRVTMKGKALVVISLTFRTQFKQREKRSCL